MNKIQDTDAIVAKLCQRVLLDFCDWLENQIRNTRRDASKLRDAGKLSESRILCERSDVFRECLTKVQQMRRASGELSERNRVNSIKRVEQSPQDVNIYNPTPEEIAAKCREIQDGWTDNERARRHWQTAKDVELNPTTFIF